MAHKQRTVQGVLQVLGSLTGNDKKFEPFIVRVSDGELAYYAAKVQDDKKKDKKKDDKKKKEDSEIEGVLDIIPLTGASLDVVNKKEKPATDFAFAIVGAGNNKKWRTVFCCDSDEMLNKWKDGITKSIDLASSNVFGTTIEDACYKANCYVPTVMKACIENIDRHLTTEGLFRVPGDKMKIESYIQTCNRGELPDFSGEEVHLVCSLLKAYLSDLRDPLVPFDSYKAFIAASNAKEDSRINEIKTLVKALPDMNRIVLTYLVAFLGRVQVENAANKMDYTNLGVVFGPTVIRNNRGDDSGTKTTSGLGLEEMASSNRLIELLIKHQKEVFTEEDLNTAVKPVYDSDLKAMKHRDVMTVAEKALVEAFIKPHAPPKVVKFFENTVSFMVNLRNVKTKELEPRIILADTHRFYVFLKGGKEETHFHYLDIKDITSPSKATALVTYQTVADKAPNALELHPVSYGSSDLDVLIKFINTQYELTFIGRLPTEKFTLTVKPADRAEKILALPAIDNEAQCGGMVKSYISVCDWKGSAVHEDVLWDLENYFAENQFKKFTLSELLNKETKFPNTDYDALMFSLGHNLWFSEFLSQGAVLGSESFTPALSDSFKSNRFIKHLDLKDAKADPKGVAALLTAFNANPNLAIVKLNLSGNEIDVKATTLLSECLDKSLSKLVFLDLSNTQLNKKAIPGSLTKSATLTMNLVELNLSDNKFDDICSTELGKYLSKTKALATLKLASTGLNYTKIMDGMIEGTNLNTCPCLRTIDLSENPLKIKQAGELVSFCKYLPNLTSLNIAAATAGQPFADSLVEMLTNNPQLTDLDVSDIDLTDDGYITFLNYLSREEQPKVPLTKLTMNYAFHKTSKTRPEAMRAVAKTLNTNAIKEFSFKGGKGNALKNDLLDMLFGLINNTTLEILDISGHQGGDPVATGIGKVLQHNNVLHTLHFDSNLTGVVGLQSIKLGLQRNRVMKHMPLPLTDISIIIKENEEVAAKVFSLCKDIQKKIYDNQLAREAAIIDANAATAEDGAKSPRILVTAKTPTATPKSLKPSGLVKTSSTRSVKRRSVYDENRAAALFGGHSVAGASSGEDMQDGDEVDDVTAEGEDEGASEGNSQGSSPAVGEKPKLSKSNSQQVLTPPNKSPSISRSTSSGDPVALGAPATPTASSGSLATTPTSGSTVGRSKSRVISKSDKKPTIKMSPAAPSHNRRTSTSGPDDGTGGEGNGDEAAADGAAGGEAADQ